MTDRSSPVERLTPISPRMRAASWLAYACAWGVFAFGEVMRPPPGLSEAFLARLLAADADTLTYLFWLCVAPLAWRMGRSARGPWWHRGIERAEAKTRGPLRSVCLSLLIAGVSLGTSQSIGKRFEGLPPMYHDEYSYLFQAKTFLAGRVSYPSHEEPRLFDQYHVVNEGRFASRYFPGTGAWMAPFVAIGRPYWGHWLAGALCAVLMFWCGRELGGEFAGLLAGLLTALAPGMALFSNLLLAHHPTLVGLSLFLLGYLRALRLRSVGWGLASGAGLCLAALCRPMTAAGTALPFGLYLVYWSIAPRGPAAEMVGRLARIKVLLAIGAPLVAGAALMLAYDRAITGNPWKTPYDLYTEVYTPRHVYGFNNVVRGERRLGPRVIEKYDTWADNLTPELATLNAVHRWSLSWSWTLGLVPLTLALVAGLVWWPELNVGTRLVLAGIVSLHVAHVPYWFVGIHGYHYVFESGPLWLLWLGAVTVQAFAAWRAERRWWLEAWWPGLLVCAVVLNYTALFVPRKEGEVRRGLWSSPLDQGLGQMDFGRRQTHGAFRNLLEKAARPLPALVLIEDDPADRHIDYVVNDPTLDGGLLIARYLPETVPVERVRQLFPDRTLFLYRTREKRLERLP